MVQGIRARVCVVLARKEPCAHDGIPACACVCVSKTVRPRARLAVVRALSRPGLCERA